MGGMQRGRGPRGSWTASWRAAEQPVVVTHGSCASGLRPARRTCTRTWTPWSTRPSTPAAGNIVSRVARDLTGGEEDAQVSPQVTLLAGGRRRAGGARGRARSTARRRTPRSTSPRWSRSGRMPASRCRRPRSSSASAALSRSRRRPPGRGARRPDQARRSRAPSWPSKYPVVLVADRNNFKLQLYKDLKLAKTYTVAVGAARARHPGRALPHPEQGGQPRLARAPAATGRATWPGPSCPAACPRTRSRRAGSASSTAPASTAPTRPARSAARPRTAASAWRCRT